MMVYRPSGKASIMSWTGGGQEVKEQEEFLWSSQPEFETIVIGESASATKSAAVNGSTASAQPQHEGLGVNHGHRHHGQCCKHDHHPTGASVVSPEALQAIPGFHLNPRLANLPPEQLQALQAMMRQQLAAYKQNGQADGVDGGAVQAGAPLTGLSMPLDLNPQAPAPPMTLVGAVKLGLIPVVRRMLEQSVEHKQTVLAQLDDEGHSLVHWAAKRGDLLMVQYLAESGAPLFLNSTDSVGMQPLHWASTGGHLNVVHFLMTRGGDINCVDVQRCTPLLIAAQYGQTETVAYLVKNGADTALLDVNGDSAMHWAAYKGELNIVQLLHHLGLPVETTDNYGQTPLHLAAMRGNLSVVEYFVLDADVQAGIKDNNGCTALDLAIKKDQKQVAAFLQSSKADSTFTWRQMLSVTQWKQWFVGGGSVEASPWPFWVVVCSNVLVHSMYPLRFLTEDGLTALGGYGSLHSWSVAAQLAMWVFFVLAWKSDPGYVHSTKDHARRDYEEELGKYSSEGMDEVLSRTPSTKPMLCHSCHIIRPVRAKHCKTCRKCVRLFDHHCPFIGNCVGGNNYRWFFLYLVTLLTAQVLFVTTCVLYLWRFGWDVLVLLVSMYVSGITLMAAMLTFYHVQLLAVNLTTNEHHNLWRYEYFKSPTGGVSNPFDAGCFRNYAARMLWTEAADRRQHQWQLRQHENQRLLQVV